MWKARHGVLVSVVLVLATGTAHLASLYGTPATRTFAANSPPVYLPVVYNKERLPLPPADEATSRITVPPGFAIRIFAQGLGHARMMAFDSNGVLYLSLSNNGQIV